MMGKAADFWRQGVEERSPDGTQVPKSMVLMADLLQKEDWFSICISKALEEHANGKLQTPTDLRMFVEQIETDFRRNLQLAREFWRKYRTLVEQHDEAAAGRK
jgi:hypothetical protein